MVHPWHRGQEQPAESCASLRLRPFLFAAILQPAAEGSRSAVICAPDMLELNSDLAEDQPNVPVVIKPTSYRHAGWEIGSVKSHDVSAAMVQRRNDMIGGRIEPVREDQNSRLAQLPVQSSSSSEGLRSWVLVVALVFVFVCFIAGITLPV